MRFCKETNTNKEEKEETLTVLMASRILSGSFRTNGKDNNLATLSITRGIALKLRNGATIMLTYNEDIHIPLYTISPQLERERERA